MRQGDLEKTRADVDFHHPFFQQLVARLAAQPDAVSLVSLLAAPLVSGFAAGKGDRATEGMKAVRQIRPTQMLPGGTLDMSEAYALPAEGVKAGDILQPGEVLFNNTNSTQWVGKTVLFTGYSGSVVCSNHVTRLRMKKGVEPVYVEAALNALQDLGYFARLCTNFNNQAGVNNDALHTVRLPLPPLPVQQELVAAMNAARALRQQQLAEAEALLGGVDTVVLTTLGIEPNPPQRNVFAVRAGEALGRVDADFHSPKFQAFRQGLENGKYPAKPIATLCAAVNSGFAAGRQDQAFDLTAGVPHLRPLNLNAQGELSIAHTKFVPFGAVSAADYCQPGEVLFNNTNSAELVGKSTVFDLAQPCACSNHMTRLRLTSEADPYYVAALFNALRSIGYLSLVCTKFNNQAGINTETLMELQIPVPPPAVQQEIVAEVQRRRAQARQLREATETGWAAAKAAFEARLLRQ